MQKTMNLVSVQQRTKQLQTYSKHAANVAPLFSGDATQKEVSTAIAGHLQQIRQITDPEEQEERVIAAVTVLAQAYGARKDIDGVTLDEAAEFIITSFPWLGINELQTAFRWHASGKTTTKAGEMYGGVFNVRALGAILTAYNDTRKKIVAKYTDAVAKEQAEQEAAQRSAKLKADFEKNLLVSVRRARAQKLPWQSIPADWHDWLKDRGRLIYTDAEKRQAWEDAKTEVEKEKEESRRDAMIGDKMNRTHLLKAIGRQDDKARRVLLAKKLLVHRKLMI